MFYSSLLFILVFISGTTLSYKISLQITFYKNVLKSIKLLEVSAPLTGFENIHINLCKIFEHSLCTIGVFVVIINIYKGRYFKARLIPNWLCFSTCQF